MYSSLFLLSLSILSTSADTNIPSISSTFSSSTDTAIEDVEVARTTIPLEIYHLSAIYLQRNYYTYPQHISWKLRYNHKASTLSSYYQPIGYQFEIYYNTTIYHSLTQNGTTDTSLSLSFHDILTNIDIPLHIPYIYYRIRVLTKETISSTFHYTSWAKKRIYLGPGPSLRDWGTAIWICSNPTTATDTRATYLVTNFEIPASKTILSATLYITGLGQFHVTINGISSNETNTPGQTDWNKKVLYSTYNIVPSLLSIGQNNTIGVILGNGMYNVPQPSSGRYTKWVGSFGPRMALVNLAIVFTDTTVLEISSSSIPGAANNIWYATDNGPISFSHEYAGEDYNQTLDITGWNIPNNNIFTLNPLVTWLPAMNCTNQYPGGVLYPSTFNPITVMDTLPPVNITPSMDNSMLVTFERNFAGYASVTVTDVPPGYGVRVWPSETAYNNNIDQSSGGTPMYWQYIPNITSTSLNNQTITVQPQFSTYGFRWLEVQVLPVNIMNYMAYSPSNISIPMNKVDVNYNGTITILQASYGVNCNSGLVGDETVAVSKFCNNQTACNYTVCVCGDNTCTSSDPPCIPDPANNCAKDFSVVWSCSKDLPNTNRSWYIPAEADNQVLPITCGPMPPAPARPNIQQATGYFTRSSVPTVGTWSSSNDWVNRIHNITLEAIYANVQSVLTDCPHRERLGWLEVSHLMFASIAYNVDISKLWFKIALDTVDSQLADGMVPDIAPEYTVFSDGFRDSPEWGSASILNPYFLYQWYNNVPVIVQTFDTGVNYINYLLSKRDPNSGLLLYGLNDWIPVVNSPMGVTATGILVQDLYAMADVSKTIMNNDTLAQEYITLAQQISTDYNTAFWNGTGYPTQCTAGIALYLNITTPANKAAAQSYILTDVISRGNVTTSGEIGNRYALLALAEVPGGIEAVWNSLLRTDEPGYGWMLTMGETALAESWFDAQGDSHIHAMYGHIDEFLYKYVAGIQMINQHWKRIALVPQTYLNGLDWLQVTFDSPRGLVSIQWNHTISSNNNNNKQRQVHIYTQIPPSSTGYLILPYTKQQIELQSGIPQYFMDIEL